MLSKLFVVLSAVLVSASNPFSSNVVALTPKNWKEVTDSRLTPEWQKLAAGMKHSVKIAYWDTEQGAPTPKLLGQIKGTPTIKYITPKKKGNKKGKYNKKYVQDYNGAREAGPMREFAEANMPSSVEKINGQKDLDKYIAKADKYGLPKALVFTKKSSANVKALSTEFRRKMLIGEVRGTKNNKAIMTQYGVKDLPAVLVLKEDGNHVRFEKKPSYNSLNFFLAKHALKKPTEGPVKKEDEEAKATPKTEL